MADKFHHFKYMDKKKSGVQWSLFKINITSNKINNMSLLSIVKKAFFKHLYTSNINILFQYKGMSNALNT